MDTFYTTYVNNVSEEKVYNENKGPIPENLKKTNINNP